MTNFHQRRKEIKKLVEELGWWNINKSALAHQHDVSRDTIYNDLRVIARSARIDIDQIAFAMDETYQKVIKESMAILNKTEAKDKTKLRAAQIVVMCMDAYTRFLEVYGIKKPKDQETPRKIEVVWVGEEKETEKI